VKPITGRHLIFEVVLPLFNKSSMHSFDVQFGDGKYTGIRGK